MGIMADLEIERWQKKCGIGPATGKYLSSLDALSRFAYDLIRIIELEKPGIRDGHGYWSGSDVIGGYCDDGTRLLAAVRKGG